LSVCVSITTFAVRTLFLKTLNAGSPDRYPYTGIAPEQPAKPA